MQSLEKQLRKGVCRKVVGLRIWGMSSPEPCREQGFFGGSQEGPEPGSSGPSAPWLEPALAENSGAVV